MNKFEDLANNEVCIRDLKQLGREGGASAYLDSGEIMLLKPKYGTISRKGYVAGQPINVALKVEYRDVFSAIRTIERNGILIARRCRFGVTQILRLTGSGYHRTRKATGGKR
ncbi:MULTISPECIES: hypothetical protein [Streptococcus anginosus group]|uniref:Uncharacterized protein n=1 Tax=Streptococcus constellatus TaxID=76860 RepID=A0A0C1HME5_STRCV|nr:MULTISPECIES: hypothetical protein [Streptococcus anginosus group]KIC78479.1 hypothetical protein RN79_02605 [Streptococcus constellatus]